jgi:hypothetical protein
MGGRIEQAASLAERVLEYQPHNLEALLVLTADLVELGMDEPYSPNNASYRNFFYL